MWRIDELARLLGLETAEVRRMIRAREIPAFWVGGEFRVLTKEHHRLAGASEIDRRRAAMDERGDANHLRLEPGDLLTVEELASLLRLTPSGVMRLKDREHLPPYRVGARWLFNRHELALWLAVLADGRG